MVHNDSSSTFFFDISDSTPAEKQKLNRLQISIVIFDIV